MISINLKERTPMVVTLNNRDITLGHLKEVREFLDLRVKKLETDLEQAKQDLMAVSRTHAYLCGNNDAQIANELRRRGEAV